MWYQVIKDLGLKLLKKTEYIIVLNFQITYSYKTFFQVQ